MVNTLASLYCSFPPYLNWEDTIIQQALSAYPSSWAERYPEMATLQWRIIENNRNGFWAICYYEGNTGYVVALARLERGLGAALEWLFEELHSLGVERVIFGGIRDPFGLGWSGLPPGYEAVADALTKYFGYQLQESWIVYALDDSAVVDTNLLVSNPTHPRVTLVKHSSPDEQEIRAFDHQQQIGECQVWAIPAYFPPYLDGRHWRIIEWIGVDAPYRQQGLGILMLQQQLAWQKAQGFNRLCLWTESPNKAAQRLVEKLGFTRIGVVSTWSPRNGE